jgi:hypothetical integral membrane protein (TIGR02206 family)
LQTFAPYGVTHVVVLLVSAAGWTAAIRSARRVKKTPREALWRRAAGGAILVVCGGAALFRLTPWTFDVSRSLPLHLCDFAWMAAAWSLLAGGDPLRVPHQLAYYWGAGFSTAGYLTPTLVEGPRSPEFWSFWGGHFLVVGAALVNYHAFRFRPGGRGLAVALGASTAVYAVATVTNLLLGTNYCYSAPGLPAHPTPLDFLGPWPLRILTLWLLAMGWLLVLSLKSRPDGRAGPAPRPLAASRPEPLGERRPV